jgi:hypothetical protein
MSSHILSSSLFSEDTITPSSSASQVFTNLDEAFTIPSQLSSSSLPLSPPSGLELKRVKDRKMIVKYPAEPEKVPVFDTWGNQTTFSSRRREDNKPRLKWGAKERTSDAWKDFREGVEFPGGEPKVYCIHCLHPLTHPGIDDFGTSSMKYHARKGCKKKAHSTTSKRTIAQLMIQKRVMPSIPVQLNRKLLISTDC